MDRKSAKHEYCSIEPRFYRTTDTKPAWHELVTRPEIKDGRQAAEFAKKHGVRVTLFIHYPIETVDFLP